MFFKVCNRQASLFDCYMAVMQLYDLMCQSPGSVWRFRKMMGFSSVGFINWAWCGMWLLVMPLLLWIQGFCFQ